MKLKTMIFVRFMAADFRLHEELSYSLKRKWPFLPEKMKYEVVIRAFLWTL